MYPWIGSSLMSVVTPRQVTYTLWEPWDPTWISVGYMRGAEKNTQIYIKNRENLIFMNFLLKQASHQ